MLNHIFESQVELVEEELQRVVLEGPEAHLIVLPEGLVSLSTRIWNPLLVCL
jgi:hypothetical protein